MTATIKIGICLFQSILFNNYLIVRKSITLKPMPVRS